MLKLVKGDITQISCDVIVNAAKPSLLGGGGVDGAIHKAAGPLLLLECMTLCGCKVGCAKITGGHRLPCRYVVHTVGPKWKTGSPQEAALLAQCYRSSIELARARGGMSVAFPVISSGAYGCPMDIALKIAVDAIHDALADGDMDVYLVVLGDEKQVSEELFRATEGYIDRVFQE